MILSRLAGSKPIIIAQSRGTLAPALRPDHLPGAPAGQGEGGGTEEMIATRFSLAFSFRSRFIVPKSQLRDRSV